MSSSPLPSRAESEGPLVDFELEGRWICSLHWEATPAVAGRGVAVGVLFPDAVCPPHRPPEQRVTAVHLYWFRC